MEIKRWDNQAYIFDIELEEEYEFECVDVIFSKNNAFDFIDARGLNFFDCDFKCKIVNGLFDNATFYECNFEDGFSFNSSSFKNCSFVNCYFGEGVSEKNFYKGSCFEECEFQNSKLLANNLSNVFMRNCTFQSCEVEANLLLDSNFNNVSWKICKGEENKFSRSTFVDSEFRECDMYLGEFVSVFLKGTSIIGGALEFTNFLFSYLKNAIISDVDFDGAILEGSIIENCQIQNCHLRDANVANIIYSEYNDVQFMPIDEDEIVLEEEIEEEKIEVRHG